MKEWLMGTFVLPLLAIIYQLLKSSVDDVKKKVDMEIKSIRDELLYLNQKQSSLLDTFLEKFSRWEDRLKDVIKNPSTTTYNKFVEYSQEMKLEIDTEMGYLREDIDRVDKRVSKAFKPYKNKNLPYRIEQKNNEVALSELTKTVKEQEKLINSSYQIMKAFDAKLKIMERKLGEVNR